MENQIFTKAQQKEVEWKIALLSHHRKSRLSSLWKPVISTMSTPTPRKTTSELEVTNISSHGIWLFSKGEEFYPSYQDFSWFKEAPVGKILHVEEPSPGHYYWPDLEIDLGIETIKHPEQFPLKAKNGP